VSRVQASITLLLAGLLSACGSSSPVGPGPGPRPTPAGPSYSSNVLVFEDWNNDGVRNADERTLGGVEVEIAARRGTTNGDGHATVGDIPAGTFPVQFGLPTLPPFLSIVRVTTVTLPQSAEVAVPVTYPIGQNTPGVFLAFGDSITSGDGSTDGYGYRARLGRKLTPFYRHGIGVDYRGGGGGRTGMAVERVVMDLRQVRPAVTLIQWGVNDYNGGRCRPDTCDALPNLRQLIHAVRDANSLPVIATLTPSNTGFDARAPEDRDLWVKEMNGLIRTMAAEEGALLADLYAGFERAPGRIRDYMTDHIHPNDAGYEIIAQVYFDALTRPRGNAVVR